MQLNDLPASFYEHKTFMFLGAGAGICTRFPPNLRLPLGPDIMNTLLEARYPSVTPEDREKKFREKNGDTAPTPDAVWDSLIKEHNSIREYYTGLVSLFGENKPIPPSYYKFARWFLTAKNVAGAATTNFDEKIDSALRSIARDASRQIGKDYHIASLPDDFVYHSDANTSFEKLLQKVHGTLSRPWSIIAGFKCIAEGSAKTARKPGNTSYHSLGKALNQASNWVFVGYSFADQYLREFIKNNVQIENKRIYIVAPDVEDNKNVSAFRQSLLSHSATRLRSHVNFDLIVATAEDFFDHILPGRNEPETSTVSLPRYEKNVLRDGPTHLGADCVGRFTGRGYEPGKVYEFPDPIYGDLHFSDRVMPGLLHFIDTGEIQRLRYIKQLSFAHLKFPAALHDRFSHTLGVTYLADKCMGETNLFDIDSSLKKSLNSTTQLALCVACVIHDCGHGPFGHTLDSVKTSLRLNRSHEQDSIRLYEVSNEQAVFADLDFAHAATGVPKKEVLEILRGSHPLSPLLSNRGLDLDRLDFILRDAYHASLALPDLSEETSASAKIASLAGNVDNVLKALRLVRLDPETSDPRDGQCPTVLVIDRSAANEVQKLAVLYASLYDEVYYCWQNVCAQSMIGIAIQEVLHSHKFTVPDVLRLTDMELFTALENFENPRVKELAYLVKYRRLYDFVGEIQFEGALNDFKSRRITQIMERLVFGSEIRDIHHPVDGPFDVLFAVRPPKVFETAYLEGLNFSGLVRPSDIRREPLATACGRVLIFKWPDSRRNLDRDFLRTATEKLKNDPELCFTSVRVLER